MVPASRQDCDRYQSLFTSHQSLRIPFPLAALEYPGPCTYAPAISDTPTPPPGLLARITIDPAVCHGKPTIRGLRYPVESILEYLSGGDTFADVLAEFPDLEAEDLQVCILFATQSLKLKSWQLVAT